MTPTTPLASLRAFGAVRRAGGGGGAAAPKRPAWSGPAGRSVPESVAAPRPVRRRARMRDVALGATAVAAIAGFNLFDRLGETPGPIWDESYYLTSTARYALRDASFASHPPLGLMLIAAGNALAGDNAGADWAAIAADKKIAGERVPAGFSWWDVRCASALFGVLAALLVFLLATRLGGSVGNGLVATSPFLFDTALLAQFRAAQLDAFQLCFVAAALLCLVVGDRARIDRRRAVCWTFGFGIACGLAAMVRANGVLLLIGTAWPCLRALRLPARWRRRWRVAAGHGAAALAGGALAVGAVFVAHVLVADREMPQEWAAARADAPFVAPAYRDVLQHRAAWTPAAAIAAIDGYRRFMAADVAGIGLDDPNGSSPWLWPLGRGAIVYRWDADGATTAYVALVPNLAAWAISLAGVVGGLVTLSRRRAGAEAGARGRAGVLLALWAAFMLADVALARTRVMYLYHYFVPLTLGWVLAAALLGTASRAAAAASRRTRLALKAACAGGVALVLAGFLQAAPLALHRPLGDQACRLRALGYGTGLCRHDASVPSSPRHAPAATCRPSIPLGRRCGLDDPCALPPNAAVCPVPR